jgi:hypothetical protein
MEERYWHDVKNRRKFFDGFAKANGFDPLIPENWYSVNKLDLRNIKVCFLYIVSSPLSSSLFFSSSLLLFF